MATRDISPVMGDSEFYRLLETLPAGAYTCDPDGLITYFNAQALELWGRAPRLNDPIDRFSPTRSATSPESSLAR